MVLSADAAEGKKEGQDTKNVNKGFSYRIQPRQLEAHLLNKVCVSPRTQGWSGVPLEPNITSRTPCGQVSFKTRM